MKSITLNNGNIATVDEDMFDKMLSFKWYWTPDGYAKTLYRIAGDRRTKHFLMHRFVIGNIDEGLTVDHINGDKLDNRRANLRVCTRSQNCMNKRITKANKTGFKGVSRRPKNRYSANIRINQRCIYLGTFDTAEEAHEVYCLWADMLHGEFANHGGQS